MPISPDKLYLVEPVLEWLDQGAPHITEKDIAFNMGWFNANMGWFNTAVEDYENVTDYKENTCGTACCLAGAIVQFNDLDQNKFTMADQVAEFLGMTEEENTELFYAEVDLIMLDLDTITPAQAAAALRGFIETGKVKWEV